MGVLFASIILSVAFSIVYLAWYSYLNNRWMQRVRNQFGQYQRTGDIEVDRVMAGYRQRETSMLTIGTILIPTSFVLLGLSVQAPEGLRRLLSIASPLVYLLWLFLSQLPVRIMNDVESELGVVRGDPTQVFLRQLYGAGHGNTWMMRFRRNFALAFVFLLISAAALIGFGP